MCEVRAVMAAQKEDGELSGCVEMMPSVLQDSSCLTLDCVSSDDSDSACDSEEDLPRQAASTPATTGRSGQLRHIGGGRGCAPQMTSTPRVVATVSKTGNMAAPIGRLETDSDQDISVMFSRSLIIIDEDDSNSASDSEPSIEIVAEVRHVPTKVTTKKRVASAIVKTTKTKKSQVDKVLAAPRDTGKIRKKKSAKKDRAPLLVKIQDKMRKLSKLQEKYASYLRKDELQKQEPSKLPPSADENKCEHNKKAFKVFANSVLNKFLPSTSKKAATTAPNNQVSEGPNRPSVTYQHLYSTLATVRLLVFLDLDNWSGFFRRLVGVLPDLVFVWGFHGGRRTWCPPHKCFKFNALTKRGMFYLNAKSSIHKNAADFAMAVQIGQANTLLPASIPFVIVSGDNGMMNIVMESVKTVPERQITRVNPHFNSNKLYSKLVKMMAK